MANKEHITLRVPRDTYEEFEGYRKERGEISKADAGRRLLEKGLEQVNGATETESDDGGDEIRDVSLGVELAEYLKIGAAFMTVMLVLVAIVQFFTTLLPPIVVGAFALVSLVWHIFAIAVQPRIRAGLSQRFISQENNA